MKNQQFGLFYLVVAMVATVHLTGCDLLPGAKKKADKKPVVEAAQVVKPAEDNGVLPKNILVRIGDWKLTIDEFNERLKLLKQGMPEFNENDPKAKQMVLDELVRQQLLVKDAESSDIANTKEIKDAVEDFRRTLLVQELATRITKEVTATDADAQKYYDENKDLFVEPIKWKVSEIVVADEATAKTILVGLLQGGDFAETAKTQSKGKTAATGGALTEFVKAPFAAMQAAIANVEAGGVSAAFKGPEGYYIVKVDAKNGGATKAFADVKKDLIAGLALRKQQQAVLDYLNKLADKTKIEVNSDLLGVPSQK